jgi:type II secretory pathway pseudopilin PulG
MLTTGQIVKNRFKVLKSIGGGAYGTVYLVEDLSAGRTWALKEVVESELPPGEQDDARALFAREGEILQSLHHPGLPEIIQAFSEGDCRYLVMQYIEGETLEELMKKRGKPFTAQEVLPWALQLAAILEYLHSRPQPVVFRDLKPSNIMLRKDGQIMLIDFGIARYFTPGKTRDTYFMGTPGFSPPEQYGRGQSDSRSDIFSFGATFFHLLTGADVAQYVTRYPPLESLVKGVPGWLNRVIMKCLSINPGERYQHTIRLYKAMEKQQFLEDETPSELISSQPSAGTGFSNARQQINKAVIFGGGLLLALVLYLVFPPILLIYMIIGGIALMRAFSCGSVISVVIVLAVLGLLAAIMVPGFVRARAQGRLTMCKSNLKNMATALEMYSGDYGVKKKVYDARGNQVETDEMLYNVYPPGLQALTPAYLKVLPECPADKRSYYVYLRNSEQGIYTVYCHGKAHESVTKENFPQYDSVEGIKNDR